MVPARQRRESLDVHTEQARERVGLGVAEGRELRRHVLDGTVALANLDTGQLGGTTRDTATVTDGACGSSVTIGAQGLDEQVGPRGRVVTGLGQHGGIPLLEDSDALTGEFGHGVRSHGLVQVAQHLDREDVIVGIERPMARLGDDEGARGPAPASRSRGGLVLRYSPLPHEHVKMAANGGRRQLQLPTQLGGGDRPIDGHGLQHPGAGARLKGRDGLSLSRLAGRLLREKHNTTVS